MSPISLKLSHVSLAGTCSINRLMSSYLVIWSMAVNEWVAVGYCRASWMVLVTSSRKFRRSWVHGTNCTLDQILWSKDRSLQQSQSNLILFCIRKLSASNVFSFGANLVWYQSPFTIVTIACYQSWVERYHQNDIKLKWHLVFFRQVRSRRSLCSSMNMAKRSLLELGFVCCPTQVDSFVM